ncbi:MAG: hypothetical protein GX567_19760 [Clostridia bacterium]|nr:hypothetical protein [Clostridia bacterium]
MMSRCYNPADPGFPRYRARGLSVADEWHSFPAFYQYAIETIGLPPDDGQRWTLDRTDNEKGYHPGNIRWATYETQERNREINIRVVYDGEKLLLIELAERAGMRFGLLYDRIFRQGWSVEQAVREPISKARRLRERVAKTEIRIRHNGEEKTLRQWCVALDLGRALIYDRLSRGWSFEEAISIPPDKGLASTRRAKRYDHEGESLTLREISKRTGIGIGTLKARLKRGAVGAALVREPAFGVPLSSAGSKAKSDAMARTAR